ncbi:hypothetical protein U9M48_041794 [Paspalum notatum var. saurae]|uniref:SWIM-type domain-containing protein n=1 Tax=Paspalum notatum var. saurae TaxID=547442 RepID=A0AAQ3XEK3_PASNO
MAAPRSPSSCSIGARLRQEGEPPPVYGPGVTSLSIEVHHGGFFCGQGANRAYLNEKVVWFDDVKPEYLTLLGIQQLVSSLDYNFHSPTFKVYWLLPERDMSDGLRFISTEDDAYVMQHMAQKFKLFVIYFDHHNHVARNSNSDDIILNSVRNLPNVISPRKVHRAANCDEEHVEATSEGDEAISASSSGSEFADSDNNLSDGDDDLFCDHVDDTVVDMGVVQGKKIGKGQKRNDGASRDNLNQRSWDEISTDEEELEVPDSDEEGEIGKNMSSFRSEDVSNPIFKIGMKFASVELLRSAITEYGLKQRRKWVLKTCTAKWLAAKYLDKFRADEKMTLTNFSRIVQLDWNFTPSRMKLSRARRIALNIIYGDEVQQYNKLWDYAHELRRSNPGSKIIKGQLMTRHYNKQKEVTEKWQGMRICPKIRKKLERNAEFANTCYVMPAGKGIFEVHDRERLYNVDILSKKCDCRRWDLTGIPCNHAISCLRHERIDQKSVLPHCYSIEAFSMAYGNNIWPCKDQGLWAHVGGSEVKPPKYEKRVGRPPKARKKAAHEVQGRNGPKLSKHGVQMHCSHCKGTGHNIATCQRKKDELPPIATGQEESSIPAESDNNEEPVITQEQLIPVDEDSQGLLSQISNPMMSQLMEESSQSRREQMTVVPLPDSSFIIANLPPPTRIGAATTAGRGTKCKQPAPCKKTVAGKKKAPGKQAATSDNH